MDNSKKYGFTLGEVLIAVLIIGVIAALTIPSLLKGVQSESRMALLKNVVASISDAVQADFTRHRTSDITSTDLYNDPKTFLETLDISKRSGSPFSAQYKNYSGVNTSVTIPSTNGTGQAAVLLKNGVAVGVVNNDESDTTYVVVDLTGPDKPNIVGSDYFIFKIERGDGNGYKAGDVAVPKCESDLVSKCKDGNGAACFDLVYLSDYDPDYMNYKFASKIKTIVYNGKEYKLLNGYYYHIANAGEIGSYGVGIASDGDYMRSDGRLYVKNNDGNYEYIEGSNTYVYDKDMNELGMSRGGTWYDKKGSIYLRDDGSGNLVGPYYSFIKQPDGTYQEVDGTYTYVYDKDLNRLGVYNNGMWHDCKESDCVRDDGNGNLLGFRGGTYIKQPDGTYQRDQGGNSFYVYDKDLNELGISRGGTFYGKKGNNYVYGSGNLVNINGGTYTKQPDGTYKGSDGYLYDENLVQVTKL